MKTTDIHIHGIGGFDTATASRKQILRISELEKRNGVDRLVPTIYSDEIDIMRLHMSTVEKAMELQAASQASATPSRVAQSEILGVHLEGPFLNPTKCGALNKSSFIEPTDANLKRLIEGYESIIKIVTIAPELIGAIPVIKTLTEMGIIVSLGHSNATYSEAQGAFYAGAKGVTHIFNAMRLFHHREPGIVGFALTNKDMFIEIIADPYHLHEKTIETVFKTRSYDKIIIVSDSVKETKTTATTTAGITNSSNVLLGGTMTLTESADRLIEAGYDKDTIMQCITTNPASYLGITA